MKTSDIEKNDELAPISMEMLELNDDDLSNIAGGRHGSGSCNYYVMEPIIVIGSPPKKKRLGGGLNFSFGLG